MGVVCPSLLRKFNGAGKMWETSSDIPGVLRKNHPTFTLFYGYLRCNLFPPSRSHAQNVLIRQEIPVSPVSL